MNRRLAVSIAVLAASGLVAPGVGATAAVAKAKTKPAPKPVCMMLTDPRGDAKLAGQGNNYAVDDIVSADIATGKKTIVGVLRLASGDSASGIPTGATYVLRWTQTQKGSDGKTSTVYAAFFFYVYATGGTSGGYGTTTDANTVPTDQSGNSTNTLPAPQAAMDSNGVITWVMKRKDASVVSGAKFSQLLAATSLSDNFQAAGTSLRGSSLALDDATGHASYADMQPSCVRAS